IWKISDYKKCSKNRIISLFNDFMKDGNKLLIRVNKNGSILFRTVDKHMINDRYESLFTMTEITINMNEYYISYEDIEQCSDLFIYSKYGNISNSFSFKGKCDFYIVFFYPMNENIMGKKTILINFSYSMPMFDNKKNSDAQSSPTSSIYINSRSIVRSFTPEIFSMSQEIKDRFMGRGDNIYYPNMKKHADDDFSIIIVMNFESLTKFILMIRSNRSTASNESELIINFRTNPLYDNKLDISVIPYKILDNDEYNTQIFSLEIPYTNNKYDMVNEEWMVYIEPNAHMGKMIKKPSNPNDFSIIITKKIFTKINNMPCISNDELGKLRYYMMFSTNYKRAVIVNKFLHTAMNEFTENIKYFIYDTQI
ncbi:MAG: hypothetical protein KDH96_12580, partial [Candidatus Riesia sp.]|nr:hypothetical protein [Candidatus Riesia sp.]